MDPQTPINYQMPNDPGSPPDNTSDYASTPAPDQPDDGGYSFPAEPPTEPADEALNYQTPTFQASQPTAAASPPQPAAVPAPASTGPATVFSGLSGNELYCLNLIGYKPGNLVVGNSVYALGFIGGLASGIRTTIGGEIQQVTNMIAGGRKLSLQRLEQELKGLSANGASGVTSELVFHPGNVEFLSIGSSIYRQDNQPTALMSSSSDGQEFYCQVDAGYNPVRFVFGNVAYSIGIGRNFLGEIKEMVKGEITQYSNIFNITRNLALERIIQEAKDCGANSVIGIRTTILPFGANGVQEMIMIGTASSNPQVASLAASVGGVLTSDLTAEETWNITRLGYVPLKLILGTSVYSIGVVGGIRAAIRGYFKGEITTLTQMIYGAREESLKKVQQQAAEIGADDVLGIKTYIYQLGGDVIEFLAIGTAVKRVNGIVTRSDQIPPQAIIRDKTTFINTADTSYNTNLNKPPAKPDDQNSQDSLPQ
ncbi:MAG TPA: heavy metal-binding domain-containing protein [Candidatus Binatia bacterium]|nr:heavy metal-binding domain-containing protein [Candidatus Binatia bacterium]